MPVLDRSAVDYVDDPATAGRLYLELREQLTNPSLSPGQVTETKAALGKLERAWPEAAEFAATASNHELGDLSPRLKRTRDQHRRERGTTSRQAAQTRRQRATKERASGPKRTTPERKGKAGRASSPRAAGRARQFGGRVLSEAAAPAKGIGEVVVTVLGASIAFAVLYALITNAQSARSGGAAIELISRSFRTGLNVLIQPVDPLNPNARTDARRQAARLVRQAATTPTRPIPSTAGGTP